MSDTPDAPASTETVPEVASTEAIVTDAAETETNPEVKAVEEVAPQTKEEAKIEKLLRKYKLKVDGVDVEEELDLNNEADVIKRLQMARMAPKAMQERAAYEKHVKESVEAIKKSLTENPEELLELHGHKKIELAKKWLAEQMQEEAKTPEQKEAEALKKELDELRAAQKKQKEDSDKSEYERVLANESEKIQNDVINAMETLKIPKNNPVFVRRLADGMALAHSKNLNLPVLKIAQAVREKMITEFRETAKQIGDDEFDDFVGEDVIKRVKASTLKKQKAAPTPVKTAETAKVSVETQKAAPMSMKDFLKHSLVNKK